MTCCNEKMRETWERIRMLAKYYLAVNIIAFIVYVLDKIKAVRGDWRIPEAVLFALAAIGGGGGAFLAMQLVRHKTQHASFMILVPVFCLLHILLWFFVWK